MADPTISAIDRFFDLVDKTVDATDHVLNRGKQIEDKQTARRARRAPGSKQEVIEAEATPKQPTKKAAIVKKLRFYIVESIAPSGETHFVVTDGGNARTECASREFAEKILRALETSQ